MKKKILWLCNRPFSETTINSTGTWLAPLGNALLDSGNIQLANISQDKVRKSVRQDCGRITQWVLPFEKLGQDGLPSRKTIRVVQSAIEEFNPDLIHIWGTENYWGLLTSRGIIQKPALLEMQGIKFACAKVFYGGLSFRELFRCIGPKELLRPSSSLFFQKRQFENWGKFEIEMIQKHRFVSTQSDWVRSHVSVLNSDCKVFKTSIALREEFLKSKPWTVSKAPGTKEPTIFTSSSGATAYKGMHVLLRAVHILKRKFPGLKLHIAGSQLQKGIRMSGYSRWLKKESRRLGLENNIIWLGPLDGEGIIRCFHQADVVVIPSFIESYCLALAEAMVVGVPAVVSYAGAMPELAKNEESALFFPPGDEKMCAWQIEKILNDEVLSRRISKNARKTGFQRNNLSTVLKCQKKIYDFIFKNSGKSKT